MAENVQFAEEARSKEGAWRKALFPGLVYNEEGEAARVAHVGGIAHYAIPDHGFWRHVAAYEVDRVVIAAFKERLGAVKDEVVTAMLQMLGTKDLFTKVAIEASIRHLEAGMQQGDPQEWVPSLRMLGFRIIVDVHGNVVDIIYPQPPEARNWG
ncbi:MAG: hypothetical protein U9R48_11530 [Chloroflexota bacterium]|nr:hypothetical protein [Chloroflexota bacterium]